VTTDDAGKDGTLTANKDLYVNAATGNDADDGTAPDPAHALRTLQRAVNIPFSYAPSQYFITIHAAAGGPSGNPTRRSTDAEPAQ
jgi:hypothetical protein